ncbi:MAG: phage portal protein [Eubacterium sp.]|nr:phage portal protein [Eubacterium sp.]
MSDTPKRHAQSRPVVKVRPVNKGYGDAGASWHKKATKGFDAKSGSPKEDIDYNNYTLRQRARMLYMAAPIATSAIKTNRTNVIGVGLQLKSRIDRELLGMSQDDADAWEATAEREFAIWATKKRNCDATGMNDFYGMQQLALASWLVSGDVFAVIKQYTTTPLQPYSMRLHLVEADRVATPTDAGTCSPLGTTTGKAENGNAIYDGVEIDSNGLVVAYHFRSTYPFENMAASTKWTRVQAYGEKTGLPNVLHISESERPDQYRGVSYLAQVIEPLLQMRRYTESELTAAVVESFFTAFIKTQADANEMPYNEVGSSLPEMSRDPNEYEMGPGQINMLEPGEDVVFGDPKRPAGGFNGFIRAICEQIGAALEIPADLLLKSFNASYSASRAALLEAWKAFKMRREWFAASFCRPVYEIWMAEAVARGRLHAPGFFSDPTIREAYLRSEWIGPSQGQLDPTKEISAEAMAVAEGFSTREQSTIRLNGGQWDANVDQLARENAKLAAAKAAFSTPETTTEPGTDEPPKEGEENG